MRIDINTLFFSILLIALTSNSVSFAAEPQFEYKLKALYITRLASFIIWPEQENSQNHSFKICINASDKVSIQLKEIGFDHILGRPVEIIDTATFPSTSQCDFLYISVGNSVPAALAYTPIFTLSSQNNFAKQGGMIEFYIEQSKVKMKANLYAMNKAGLKVSSKLLMLLKIVKPLSTSDY